MMPLTQNGAIKYSEITHLSSINEAADTNSADSKWTSDPTVNTDQSAVELDIVYNLDSKHDNLLNGGVGSSFAKITRKARLSSDGRGGYMNLEMTSQSNASTSSVSDEDFEDIPLKSPDDEIIIFQQPLSPKYSKGPVECRKQLLKDGYRLDEQSDDEDLDLVLPVAKNISWCTCERYCTIQ